MPASALAVGSVHVPVLLIVAAVLCVAMVLALRGVGSTSSPPTATWLIVAATLVTLLQLVPLRHAWLAVLAPASAEIWDGALSPFKEGAPVWLPLSLAPGATAVEALKGFTYLCAFLAAASAGARKGAHWGALLLGGSALVMAVATLGHGLLRAETLFGVYAAQTGARGWKLAPLINPNNLAGYLNFGALSTAGLLALPRPPLPRWLLGLGLALITAVSVLTGSRAGALSLATGTALLVVLLRASAKRGNGERGEAPAWREFALSAFAALAFGVACAFVAFGARIWQLLRDDNVSKVDVALQALRLSAQHPLLGIGRGAFESVFPATTAGGDNVIYSHPENFVAQWLVEWGLPFGVLMLAAAAWHLRPSYWGALKNPAASGIYAAFTALTLQNLFDLSFEVPGVAIAAATGAGFCIGAQAANSDRPGSSRRRHGTLLLTLVGVLGITTFALAAVRGRPTLNEAKRTAQAATEAVQPGTWPELRQQLRGAMQRFPGEPYFPRMGAVGAWKTHAESPLPWIDRALERGMAAGRTHYLLGAYLASRKLKSQALLELQLAATHDPQLVSSIAAVALGLTTDPEELKRVAPEGPPGVSTLVALARAMKQDHAGARVMLADATTRSPDAVGPRRLLLELLLDELERDSPDCSQVHHSSCAAQAQAQLDALAKSSLAPEELSLLRARLLLTTDRAKEALILLREECPRATNRWRCYRTLADAAGAARDVSALSELGKLLQSEPCVENAAECSNAIWRVGSVAKAIGATDLALTFFEQAAGEEASAQKWLQVAQAAEAAGQQTRALNALNRVILLAPDDSKHKAQADRMRLKLLLSTSPH